MSQLSVWTIYKDVPPCEMGYQARESIVTSSGISPRDGVVVVGELHLIREHLLRQGLTPIGRSVNDDPSIVEVWI